MSNLINWLIIDFCSCPFASCPTQILTLKIRMREKSIEIVQLMKCSLFKHENLSSILIIPVRRERNDLVHSWPQFCGDGARRCLGTVRLASSASRGSNIKLLIIFSMMDISLHTGIWTYPFWHFCWIYNHHYTL